MWNVYTKGITGNTPDHPDRFQCADDSGVHGYGYEYACGYKCDEDADVEVAVDGCAQEDVEVEVAVDGGESEYSNEGEDDDDDEYASEGEDVHVQVHGERGVFDSDSRKRKRLPLRLRGGAANKNKN